MTQPGPPAWGDNGPHGSPVPGSPPAWEQPAQGGGHAGYPGPPLPPYVPGPPTPYGQQPFGGYPYMPPRRTNGMAVASMVLGILWLYWIGSVLALVFGYVAKQQIRERGETGDGMATAGIVLGWVGVGLFVLVMMLGVASSV